ncbi:MAG: hypothetical protein H6806_10060 [Planctomycetes bacterium]|nr:hypothetical protein [Planctomycetota bacterium]MCB9824667.1 hypothetical protein [Planctomycetota bacterium]MCB9830088.1 hypothetical protein [Planctomycetota bacterium]MCB9899921.1 hypothetical protein [Planctomycetota bacterium]
MPAERSPEGWTRRYGPWCVHSDVDLAGLLALDDVAEPHLVLRAGRVPQCTTRDATCWDDADDERDAAVVVLRRGDLHVLDFPGDGLRAELHRGAPHRVVYDAMDLHDESDLVHLLADQVLPRCLAAWTPSLVLHAAAGVCEGQAWVFVGPSGRGKSTIAAALHARGWTVLGDDAIALVLGDTGPRALTLRTGVREVGADEAKAWRMLEHPPQGEGLPLAGLLTLLPRTGGPLRIERLRGVDAAMALVGSAFRLDPGDPTRPAGELAVVQHVPAAGVYAVAVPDGQEGCDQLLAWLEAAAARLRDGCSP